MDVRTPDRRHHSHPGENSESLNEAKLVGLERRGGEKFQNRSRFPRTWFLVGENTKEVLLDDS